MRFGFCYKLDLKKKKKKTGKESQYMVSRPELSSDPPIGSDRESGCDTKVFGLLTQTVAHLESFLLIHFLFLL